MHFCSLVPKVVGENIFLYMNPLTAATINLFFQPFYFHWFFFLVRIFCIPHLSFYTLSLWLNNPPFSFYPPSWQSYLSKTHCVYILLLFQGAVETLWSASTYLLSQILWFSETRLLSVPVTPLGSWLECANYHILLLIL